MSTCESCVYDHDCNPLHKDDTHDCDGYVECDPRQGIDRSVMLTELTKLEIISDDKLIVLSQHAHRKACEYIEQKSMRAREEAISAALRLYRSLVEDGMLTDIKAKL